MFHVLKMGIRFFLRILRVSYSMTDGIISPCETEQLTTKKRLN